MIIHEIAHTEKHPVYQKTQFENSLRQLNFLLSIIESSLSLSQNFLSQTVIKALNYHAIACLHFFAGEYRQCNVKVGNIECPEHFRLPTLMDHFVNSVNRYWNEHDIVTLSAYVLWKLNCIHPFINGNGRTARACCYFVLCLKLGVIPNTQELLPNLLTKNRDKYLKALRLVDNLMVQDPQKPLKEKIQPLSSLITELMMEQLSHKA